MANTPTDAQISQGMAGVNAATEQYENANLPAITGEQGSVDQGPPFMPGMPSASDVVEQVAEQNANKAAPKVESEPTETTQTPAAKDLQKVEPQDTTPGAQKPPPNSALAKLGTYSTVTPGGKYNGVQVPPHAHFVVGDEWFDAQGIPIVDAPIKANGSVNRLSSAYLAETESEYLKMGMPGVMVQELMGNLVQQSNAVKDFQLKAADDILNQQALTISNKRAGVDLVKTLAANVAEANAKGQQFGMLAFHSLMNRLGPGTNAILSSVVPGFTNMNPAQQYQAMVSLGTAAGTEQQQRQENVALTQQNIQTERQARGFQAAKEVSEVTPEVAAARVNLNQTQNAIKFAETMPNLGKPGATLQDWLTDIGQDPRYATFRSIISVNGLERIKSALGASNRLNQTEYNQLNKIVISKDMPSSSIVKLLKWNAQVQQADYNAALEKSKNIIKTAKQNNPGLNVQASQQANRLVAPLGMNQVKFLRWANSNGIYGKNAAAAWKHYQTLKE